MTDKVKHTSYRHRQGTEQFPRESISQRCNRISNDGFTLIETMIAMGLMAVVGILAISAFWKVMDLQRVAERRVDTDQNHAMLMTALANSNSCAGLLKDHLTSGVVTTSSSLLDVGTFFTSGQMSALSNGPVYKLTLVLPTGSSYPTTLLTSGYGRTTNTIRYLATLSLSETIAKNNTSSVSEIPISMEFDAATSKLTYCTLNPDDADEALHLNQHTVRECVAGGGTPYPTPGGLLCRFPVTVVHTGQVMSCPGGWTSAGYNSTTYRDFVYQSCSGNKSVGVGWHYLSSDTNTTPEKKTLTDVKSGTTTTFNWQVWGGATGGMLVIGMIGLFTPGAPLVLLAIALGFLFSFTDCHVVNYDIYAQGMATGCY